MTIPDNPGYQCVDEEVARIIRQQAERDAAYWDVGIAAIHVYYTGNGEAE